MRRIWFGASLLLGIGSFANASPMNLVQDPDFSTSGVPTSAPSDTTSSAIDNIDGGNYAYDVNNAVPWVFTTGSGVSEWPSGWGWPTPPSGGSQNAFLQAYNGRFGSWTTSSISQQMSGLTAGDHYTLEFYLSARGTFPTAPVEIDFGGVDIGSVLPQGPVWTFVSLQLVASSSTEELTFFFDPGIGQNIVDYDAGLANVQLYDPAMTPESSSLVLSGSGLLILIFGMSRSKENRLTSLK